LIVVRSKRPLTKSTFSVSGGTHDRVFRAALEYARQSVSTSVKVYSTISGRSFESGSIVNGFGRSDRLKRRPPTTAGLAAIASASSSEPSSLEADASSSSSLLRWAATE
jgi:hypothetical protein